MYIKLKNGKEVYISPTTNYFIEKQCDWCSKTIKKDKQIIYQDGYRNGTCSMAHAKAFLNAKV